MNRYKFVDGALTVTQVETKTRADLVRVIAAGKPDSVVERFAAMYLDSLDPNQALKDAWYGVHARIEALEAIPVTETRPQMNLDANGAEVLTEVVVKAGRELTAAEQAELVELLTERGNLEDGYTVPPLLDEDGVETAPARLGAGTPWLKTLRGAGTEPVPAFTPQPVVEYLAAAFPERARAARHAAIDQVRVTHPVSGRVFDGDKAARDALTTAVVAGDPGESTPWKLADNSVEVVTWEELRDILRLVGVAHTGIIAA